MNKTPIITVVAMLLTVLFVFSGCEISIDLNEEENTEIITETSVETVVVTDEEGSTALETVIHTYTTQVPASASDNGNANDTNKSNDGNKNNPEDKDDTENKGVFGNLFDFGNKDNDKDKANNGTKDTTGNKSNTDNKGNAGDKETSDNNTDSGSDVSDKADFNDILNSLNTIIGGGIDNVNGIPVVTVVDVTDNKGDVVATEKVTLSKDEVEAGQDFFEPTTQSDVPDEPASDRVTTSPAEDDSVQDDLAVLNSSKYMVIGRAVSGDASYPYKIARDGDKCSMTTVYNDQEVCIIVGTEYVFLITPEQKSYIRVAKTLVEDEAAGDDEMSALLNGSGFSLYANKKEVERKNKTIDGVNYTLIKYDDGTVDYLNGKTLVKTVAEDGSVLYYDTITTEVSQGVFLPPVGYTEQVIDPNGSTTSEVCTDPAHDHSNE